MGYSIAINCLGAALANNGGTKVVRNLTESLIKLGHDVCVVNYPPKELSPCTWWKFPDEVEMIWGAEKPPDKEFDLVIATSHFTVDSTLCFNSKYKGWFNQSLGFHNKDIDWLLPRFKSGLTHIAISKSIQKLLMSYNINSYLVYPGWKKGEWKLTNKGPRRHIVGAQYSFRESRNGYDVKQYNDAEDIIEKVKECIPDVQLVSLGKDIKTPDRDKLQEFYNQVAVWVNPNPLGTLPLPPMESAWCGVAQVCADSSISGKEFIEHGLSGYRYKRYDLDNAAAYITSLLLNPFHARTMSKNCRERLALQGDRDENTEKMVSIMMNEGNKLYVEL